MNYLNAIKDNLLTTTTQNNDTAFRSTGSHVLDLYSLMGGMRNNYNDLSNLFIRSFYDDQILTLKILFHLRDILGGLGERNSFRYMFNMFANLNPNIAKKVISLIPVYGRYDDLFAGLNTPIENDILKFVEITLEEDLYNYNNGLEYSLLSKWLPSINTSNKDAVLLAKKIARYLNMSDKSYRQMLSKLRKGKIIENNLRVKDYSFNYETVPSLAMLKYNKAFIRNDNEAFRSYIEDVVNGAKKINTKAASVTDVMYGTNVSSDVGDVLLNTYWDNLPKPEILTKTIVVRDGSSSMTWSCGKGPKPIEVATALSLYFAEILPEPFKDHFITFSAKPELIKIKGKNLKEKKNFLETYDDYRNTNISLIYDLLLNVARSDKVKQEDMVEQVVIISDMEFDVAVEGMSTFDLYKVKFSELNLKMPELVFWNVNANDIHYPVKSNEYGVKLVSGSSQKIIELVISNDLIAVTPYDFMIMTLDKYKDVDELLK